ncbi:hypothetical protein [Mesorhizobium amorphae]|uniref:hypothetical protein n=1 Tax=Mesorhizobium amorphae TaxID=71433 RepID=UPI0021B2935A|nr:hypothetical protein [Mesorhizobium amorphae]
MSAEVSHATAYADVADALADYFDGLYFSDTASFAASSIRRRSTPARRKPSSCI